MNFFPPSEDNKENQEKQTKWRKIEGVDELCYPNL